MKALPQFQFVRSRNVSIGYTRWGQGDHLVFFTPPLVSNIELMWELPEWERVLDWAGRHHQVIMMDKRGVGLSDRVTEPSTLEDYVGDVLAVMDAEGVESAHFVGHSEGGIIAAALAALHPSRVRRLCMLGAPGTNVPSEIVAKFADDAHPVRHVDGDKEIILSLVRSWGRSESVWLDLFAPTVAGDDRVRRWWARFERQSCSSGSLLAMFRSMEQFDFYPLLNRIKAPTLVCHSVDDRVVPVSVGRTYASLIPGAKLVEWNNPDHVWGFAPNWREAHNDIIEFLIGSRPGSGARKQIGCVMFTDIVDSTRRASEHGDAEWRKIKELHDSVCRLRVAAHEGTLVKNTGDGALALFSDPEPAVQAAIALTRELAASGIPIRAGLHMGQIEIQDDGDLTGIAVNIAARVQDHAGEGEVAISQTVHDLLLGSSHSMKDLGKHRLKGIEGAWRIYVATD